MSLRSGVLALDLSSKTGWAFGHPDTVVPSFGVWALPWTQGEGAKYASFENELAAAIEALKPAIMVIEAPLSFQALLGVSNMKVMTQQYTLRGIALAEAWRANMMVSEVQAEKVRDAMLGQSRFKKGTVKAAVIAYCQSRGWSVPDDNAADACLTWAWRIAQIAGRPPIAGPLFQERLHG